MKPTRREFLEVTGAAITLSAVPFDLMAGGATIPHDGPCFLHGDPYESHVFSAGLGGSSFEELRDRMLRERTDGDHLHSAALGLEAR
jgi:hypothetical protein